MNNFNEITMRFGLATGILAIVSLLFLILWRVHIYLRLKEQQFKGLRAQKIH